MSRTIAASRQPFAGAFSNVDNSIYSKSLISYLDRANTDPQVQWAKTQVIERLLRPKRGENLLDVGCGVGHDALKLAELVGTGGSIVGLDRSANMIQEARARNRYSWPRLRFHLGDVHCLDLDSNSFDGCLVTSTFIHLEHPVKALKEMVRVLKKGGRLVALEPDWDTLVMTVGNTAASRIIVNKIRQSVRHSGIAHELPVLFRKAGLSFIGVEAGTTLSRDYTLASDVWRIEENVKCASQTTVAKTHKTNELLRQLKKANKNEEFFMASTSFAVYGTKATDS